MAPALFLGLASEYIDSDQTDSTITDNGRPAICVADVLVPFFPFAWPVAPDLGDVAGNDGVGGNKAGDEASDETEDTDDEAAGVDKAGDRSGVEGDDEADNLAGGRERDECDDEADNMAGGRAGDEVDKVAEGRAGDAKGDGEGRSCVLRSIRLSDAAGAEPKCKAVLDW